MSDSLPPVPDDVLDARFEADQRVQLVPRLRVVALGLALGALLGISLLPAGSPILLTVASVAAVVGLLPRRWSTPISPALTATLGIAATAACLPAPGAMTVALGVVVAGLFVVVLPVRGTSRAIQLLGQGSLLFFFGDVDLTGVLASVGGLAIAWAYGHLQVARRRSLWQDREILSRLTERLAAERDAREAAIAAREGELRTRHDRMVKQEQWATLGRVAVGVGHEIKNPLQAALSAVETARDTGDLASLDDAVDALHRIGDLLRDLSLLRGTSDAELDTVDLAPVVESAIRGARMGLPQVHVTSEIDVHAAVRVNQARLAQVFANLFTNAWHACERRGAARIHVHARALLDGVQIVVDDDGPGLPAELGDRAFEAFVTTKRAGKGSGLGLAISRAMVQSMGGDLSLGEGNPMGGARFVLDLPYAPDDAPRATVRLHRDRVFGTGGARPKRPRTPPPKVHKRVPTQKKGVCLVIDDDPQVCRSVARVLRRRWDVHAVPDTQQARHILRTTRVDVILCDMHLTREDALDAIAVVQDTRPDLVQRIVFMSGEPTSSRLVALAQANRERLMGKPFELATGLALLDRARRDDLPWLEVPDDAPSVDDIAVLEPAWTLESPTEEIVIRTHGPGHHTPV